MLTLLQWIARLTKGYIRHTGKQPDGLAKLKIKMEAAKKVKDQSTVVQGNFNPNEKWWEARPGKEIEEVIPQEVISKESPMTKDKFFRIKQGLSTKIKLNTLGENKQLAKELLNKKNVEFNSLDRPAQKEILERLDINIKNAKADFATPVDPDDFASGGIARVGMFGGGLLRKFLLNKKTVREAVDDIFPTGDYKYDAEMAAQALVENNPKFFKNKLLDDLSDADRSDIYGAVLSEVQNDLAKMLQTKRLSKPTKTLEGIKKEGTIDISDPEVADEFSRFMKESDPKGYKDLEQKIEIESFDVKGRKKNASGGIAGQLHLNEGGRIGFKKGTMRDRLQKDYESLTAGADWMRTAPPKWWLFPEKYGMTRDDAMTWFKERFMYGNLDAIPTPLEAFKKSPELVKFKEWLEERKEKASGGIAGQLHLNRPGYQQGNEVLPPRLRALKSKRKKIPSHWSGTEFVLPFDSSSPNLEGGNELFDKIASYDKDVMPEEYKIPGSGGYGSILRHAGNTALLKKQFSEKGFGDTLGGILALGGGTLHELTADSPIWVDEKRTVEDPYTLDVGSSKKLSPEFKEDMLANLYGALYGKTGIKDKEVLDRLIERLSKQDNWSEIFQELIAEQAPEDPERPMRPMPRVISRKVRNPRTGKIETKMVMIDSPFSNKKLTHEEFIEEMEDKGKLATSATEGSFAKGGLAQVLGV